jgi:hypothetical protein
MRTDGESEIICQLYCHVYGVTADGIWICEWIY